MSSKGRSKEPEPTSIWSLPDDLVLNCLARVPRVYHYYPLSFVSKKFKSMVESADFYKTRSLINRSESCLYLGIRHGSGTNWYTLCKNVYGGNSSGNIFVRIKSPGYSCAEQTSTVAVGSNIYQIGGAESNTTYVLVPCPSSPSNAKAVLIPSTRNRYELSSSVYVLDCLSHKWHQAPSMRVDRGSSTASVVDGKIYVAGGEDLHSFDFVEVFDPKTQTWDSVPNPRFQGGRNLRTGFKSLGLEGKFYLFREEDVVYNPKEGIWNPLGGDMDMAKVFADGTTNSYCVIDNILFYFCKETSVFKWFDSLWKELHGLEVEELPYFGQYGIAKMSDLGGKMVVLWFGNWRRTTMWCAEIALERRNNGDEIWGKIEWFDLVLTLRNTYSIGPIDVLSVIV